MGTKAVEKIKIHTFCSITFFSENRTVYEIMWENIVERGRRQMTTNLGRVLATIVVEGNNKYYIF